MYLSLLIYQTRNRTNLEDIIYAISLYFDGLSLRNTSKALSRFIKKSHTTIRYWIQKYKPQRLLSKTKKIDEFIVDKILLKVGSTEFIWLEWIAIEPENKEILAVTVSRERNMLIAEKFISGLVKDYDKHPVSTDRRKWNLVPNGL